MVISIASSCDMGMGMLAAYAIGIMQRWPKKLLARNTPTRTIFILI